MNAPDRYRFRFGTAVYDEARAQLLVDGQIVEIQRRPLQVLSLLVRHPGHMVSREEFQRVVWQGRPTVDNVLANAIAKLRGALGPDLANAIETVQGAGYRFSAAVSIRRDAAAAQQPSEIPGLKLGGRVPHREAFVFDRLLSGQAVSEVWQASDARTGAVRVFKFVADEGRLASLRREVTLSRLLRSVLGPRPDFVPVLDWNFNAPPYFVESEYGGVPLDEWARADGRLAAMAMAGRLELFGQIAGAVSAAHSHGVLHKDLKPSNILVARSEDGWQCRLLDFGSGRLLDQLQLGELGITPMGLTFADSAISDTGRGTLLYAAPELLRDESATTRSDVYALGILLYQLVVADFSRGMEVGWEREVADPLLRQDIAEATDGDPVRRFDSAHALLARVATLDERHRQTDRQHAEQAQREQQRQAFERLRARRPWLYGLIASLCLGLAVSVFLYWRLARARDDTARHLATAGALNDVLVKDIIASADPIVSGRGKLTLAEALEHAGPAIGRRMSGAPPETRAVVHGALQQTFGNLSRWDSVIEEGGKALRDWAQVSMPDLAQVATVRLRSAYAHMVQGHRKEVDEQLAQVDVALKAMDHPPPELQARYWHMRSQASGRRYELEASRAEGEKAWALASQPSFNDPDLDERIELSLSDVYNMTNKIPEAERMARDLLSRQIQRWGEKNARTCYTRVALAQALSYLIRHDEAIREASNAAECLESILGLDHQRTLTAKNALAAAMFQAERYVLAADIYGQVAERFRVVEGPQSLTAEGAEINRGQALYLGGQLVPAERVFVRLLAERPAAQPTDAPTYQRLRYLIARCRLDQGRADGVAPLLDGLDPEAIKKVELEYDWPQRLDKERQRLGALTRKRSVSAQ